ncbi:MAG: DUF1592 domain-containing protein [Phycisphaera sp.]|nr:DUF1592 domain-containing protein [Phycisphaera sp.]
MNSSAFLNRLTFVAVLSLTCAASVHAAEPPTKIPDVANRFFNAYCIDCHGPKKHKGDFRVDTMLKVSTTREDAEYWQLVRDNLSLGDMPPEKAKQPKAAEVEPVTEWIEGELRRARRMLGGHADEVVLRRLNRTEYQYTIEDLFDVRGDFAEAFPADAKSEGFDNIGASLALSAEQVDQYMAAADYVLDRAIVTKPRPETKMLAFSLADHNVQIEENEKRQEEYRKKHPPSEFERKKQEAERAKGNYGHGYYPKYGEDELIPMKYMKPETRHLFPVREAGWYRFKVVGYAARNPDHHTFRLQIEYGSFGQADIPQVAGVVQYTDETPVEAEYRVYLQPNQQIRLSMQDGPNWMWGSHIADNKEAVVAIHAMEMEGPLIEQWPPRGHRTLLGERDAKALTDDDMPRVFAELAPRLFRRPVSEAVVGQYVDFYKAARSDMQPLDAFRYTVKAMMVSPHFLYHVEVGANPDAYAIANRLSYFLWRSAPDDTLYRLAASGKLMEPGVLHAQVDRMLADGRSDRFLRDFVGQWLDVDRVGDMQPDAKLYPEYDEELERAMVDETRAFFREMLDKDLPLSNLIDSDWAMLNDRLARHYGIPDVKGNQFRRVALDKQQTVRGGLLTQASVLNVTSNGTVTSPVVRGVWLLRRLLGTPPSPPPPDVPAIEPDIRGASTIQQQLAAHRNIEQCAACHSKIDPYGMALENFDVIGQWRDKYRALEPTRDPDRPKLVDGQTVVASDTLPKLGAYDDFRGFRALLLKRQDLVCENVARTLSTYALGRAMGFVDEQYVRDIAAETQARHAGLKTMIHALVTSELFRKP